MNRVPLPRSVSANETSGGVDGELVGDVPAEIREPEPLEVLWGRFAPTMYGFFRRGLGPDAEIESCVQAVFLVVLRDHNVRSADSEFRRALYTAAADILRRRIRSSRIRNWMLRLASRSRRRTPETAAIRDPLHRLYRVLDQLSAFDRTMFVLRQSEGMSLDDISRVLDLSLSSTKKRLSHAGQRVRALMKQDSMLAACVSDRGLAVLEEVRRAA